MPSSLELNKEKEEKFYLEKFLNRLGVFPKKIIRGADPPDFYIQAEDSTEIFCELTKFYSLSNNGYMPRQAIEGEWQHLQKTINNQRMSKYPNLNSVNSLLCFKELLIPQRREHEKFILELFGFVISKQPILKSEFIDFYFSPIETPMLNRFLKKIYLSNTRCSFISWEWNHSAGGAGLNEEDLLQVIQSKINSRWMTKKKESWLLVVSGLEISQLMGHPEIERLQKFGKVNLLLEKSEITKLFIYEYALGRILEWNKIDLWKERRPANFY